MFTINGKEYEDGKFTFKDLVTLEEQGIDFQKLEKITLKSLIAFMAIAMKCSIETATEEIDKHLENGGNFELIVDVINKMVDESAFFKSLRATENQTEEKIKNEKTTKTQKNG